MQSAGVKTTFWDKYYKVLQRYKCCTSAFYNVYVRIFNHVLVALKIYMSIYTPMTFKNKSNRLV